MSEKQQTPIQKAIAFLNHNNSAPTSTPQIDMLISYLQSLLEEEKKFAEEAFKAGNSHIEGKPHFKWDVNFVDYYTKYTTP